MKRALRVLTVARWYPSHDGPGRGSFVADLVQATVAAGVEARVVSFDRVMVRGRLEDRERVRLAARAAYDRVATPTALFVVPASRGAPDVPVARVPVIRRPGSDDAAALVEDHLAALRPFVDRLLAEWRPDVIHAHTGLPDGIVAAQVGRELGIPVVVSEHASTIEAELADPVALDRYRDLLGPGVRLLAVSPPVARRIADLLGIPAADIRVVPNPVDDASFPPADPAGRAGRDQDELLWVGTLGEHKGIEVLLRACARLRATRPRLHLRLIGGERTTGDIARWRSLAAELGIGDALAFEGWLERRAVVGAMARASVFVHPSPSETFGVVAAEAILSGLPVATRRSGGVPWIVQLSGGFGAVAGDDGEAAFAEAIETLLDGRTPVVAADARARLVAELGRSAVAARTLACYREAVGDGAGPGSVEAPPVPPPSPPTSPGSTDLPRILVATGRALGLGLVAELPAGLRERVVLVAPPLRADTPPDSGGAPPGSPPIAVRLFEAAPARYERPPSGRSPISRLKRATWRPPPTADEELVLAIRRAVKEFDHGGGPLELVGLDAPAAVIVAGLDPRRVRLAPGALRWLADRWDAQARAEGQPGRGR
jgi:glycosyltransferase involved in cell wall biosynthesis